MTLATIGDKIGDVVTVVFQGFLVLVGLALIGLVGWGITDAVRDADDPNQETGPDYRSIPGAPGQVFVYDVPLPGGGTVECVTVDQGTSCDWDRASR